MSNRIFQNIHVRRLNNWLCRSRPKALFSAIVLLGPPTPTATRHESRPFSYVTAHPNFRPEKLFGLPPSLPTALPQRACPGPCGTGSPGTRSRGCVTFFIFVFCFCFVYCFGGQGLVFSLHPPWNRAGIKSGIEFQLYCLPAFIVTHTTACAADTQRWPPHLSSPLFTTFRWFRADIHFAIIRFFIMWRFCKYGSHICPGRSKKKTPPRLMQRGFEDQRYTTPKEGGGAYVKSSCWPCLVQNEPSPTLSEITPEGFSTRGILRNNPCLWETPTRTEHTAGGGYTTPEWSPQRTACGWQEGPLVNGNTPILNKAHSTSSMYNPFTRSQNIETVQSSSNTLAAFFICVCITQNTFPSDISNPLHPCDSMWGSRRWGGGRRGGYWWQTPFTVWVVWLTGGIIGCGGGDGLNGGAQECAHKGHQRVNSFCLAFLLLCWYWPVVCLRISFVLSAFLLENSLRIMDIARGLCHSDGFGWLRQCGLYKGSAIIALLALFAFMTRKRLFFTFVPTNGFCVPPFVPTLWEVGFLLLYIRFSLKY